WKGRGCCCHRHFWLRWACYGCGNSLTTQISWAHGRNYWRNGGGYYWRGRLRRRRSCRGRRGNLHLWRWSVLLVAAEKHVHQVTAASARSFSDTCASRRSTIARISVALFPLSQSNLIPLLRQRLAVIGKVHRSAVWEQFC